MTIDLMEEQGRTILHALRRDFRDRTSFVAQGLSDDCHKDDSDTNTDETVDLNLSMHEFDIECQSLLVISL
jgi:hypothetical protein